MEERTELDRLLAPRAIAVIGATSKPGRVGRIVFERLLGSGRPLYPVHPKESEVLGEPVVPSIGELPDDVDVAVITIGAGRAVQAAEDCGRRGIPFAIVVAGGFGEVGQEGRALEKRLRAIPAESGTRLLGPNTLGLFVPSEDLDTIFVEHGDEALSKGGGVAFVTQSGSVGVEALGLASNIGFGMRAFVGLGNKCDLDELDLLHHFAADDQTSCLAFYVENLDRGREFLQAAREASGRKPVVVLKAGRSEAGAAAVSSHTGRLAGSDRVLDGAFRQHGMQRVFDDEELCDAARTLALLPPAPGNRVAFVTPAGGYGVMGADHVEVDRGRGELQMARLSPRTESRIREATLPFAAVSNPVDITASADDEMFGASLDALLEDDGVDIVICVSFFAPPAITDGLLDTVAERATRSSKPVISFTEYGPFTDEYLRAFHDRGVIGFPSIGRAVRAARFLVERAQIVEALGGSR
jgi:acetate---CoA ligase (ADP-forming)